MSIQAIESGKLQLSQKMAQKISLHTGVSMRWLLANKCKVPAVCDRDLERPYTPEIFRMTRAEVSDPRSEPLDVRAIQNILAVAYARLSDAARLAYRANEIIYFHYALREFLEQLDRRWPDSRELQAIMDVSEIARKSQALFEKTRREKLHSKTSKKEIG
jgi:hypothetical protein